jgi:polar amino acid transport system substrate-binding protein
MNSTNHLKTMKHSILLSTLLCVLSGVHAHAAEKIVAGSMTNSPPMISYANDGTTLQGAIVDLAAAMSKQMGRTIEFKSIPFPGLMPAMQAKQIDITFTLMSDTPERQKVVDFVDL